MDEVIVVGGSHSVFLGGVNLNHGVSEFVFEVVDVGARRKAKGRDFHKGNAVFNGDVAGGRNEEVELVVVLRGFGKDRVGGVSD